jgi:hypothetical protein
VGNIDRDRFPPSGPPSSPARLRTTTAHHRHAHARVYTAQQGVREFRSTHRSRRRRPPGSGATAARPAAGGPALPSDPTGPAVAGGGGGGGRGLADSAHVHGNNRWRRRRCPYWEDATAAAASRVGAGEDVGFYSRIGGAGRGLTSGGRTLKGGQPATPRRRAGVRGRGRGQPRGCEVASYEWEARAGMASPVSLSPRIGIPCGCRDKWPAWISNSTQQGRAISLAACCAWFSVLRRRGSVPSPPWITGGG